MFKKRHLLILAVLLLMHPLISVSALESETIHDQKHASGDTFEVLNKTYKVSLFSDNKKLLVSVEDISFTIDVTKCEIKDDLQICFDSAELWYTNYTLDRTYYKAKIVFNRLLAKITVTREIDSESINPGELININTIIKNTGSIQATDINLSDAFPKELEVIDFKGCLLSDNALVWKGNLSANEEKKCSYTLRGSDKVRLKSKASAGYFNGKQVTTSLSDQVTLNVNDHKISIYANVTNKSLDVDDETAFKLVINNTDPNNRIGTSLKLTFDDSIEILSSPRNIVRDGNGFKFADTLDPNQAEEFIIPIRFKEKGDKEVKLEMEYIFGALRNKVYRNYIYGIGKPKAEPTVIENKTIEKKEKQNNTLTNVTEVMQNNSFLNATFNATLNQEKSVTELAAVVEQKQEEPRSALKVMLAENYVIITIIALFVVIDIIIAISIYKKLHRR